MSRKMLRAAPRRGQGWGSLLVAVARLYLVMESLPGPGGGESLAAGEMEPWGGGGEV